MSRKNVSEFNTDFDAAADSILGALAKLEARQNEKHNQEEPEENQ